KSGEFLGGIASQHNVTLADLLAVNKLTVKSVILPGQQLALAANGVAAPAAGTTTSSGPAAGSLTYTVKKNDFLAGIAAAYTGSLPDLPDGNKLNDQRLIPPG